MKVLSISTDRKIFDEVSPVLGRSLQYASKMQELHIVVFSNKSLKLEKKQIGNLFIYPTNSSSKLFYIFDAIKIGKEIIKKNEFDINSSVITCQDAFETGLVGVSLKKSFHFPLQIQVHTDFLSKYFRNSLLNKIRVIISKFTIPKADGIRVVSSVIQDSILEKFSNVKADIKVLPIFVDVNEYFFGNKAIDSGLNILLVSRLEEEKRIDVALSVLKEVVSKFPDLKINIAGDGRMRKELEALKNKLGLNNVAFLGWRNDVSKLFSEANIYLLTSEYEGYGMTLMQAGLSGATIVTTNVGLAKTELFKDGVNSYVCPVGDVECLSKKLSDLITNEEKRKSFANNMHDNIKSISISREDYVNKYITLQESLLKK